MENIEILSAKLTHSS